MQVLSGSCRAARLLVVCGDSRLSVTNMLGEFWCLYEARLIDNSWSSHYNRSFLAIYPIHNSDSLYLYLHLVVARDIYDMCFQ